MTARELLPFVCLMAGAVFGFMAWAVGTGIAGAVCGAVIGAGVVLALYRTEN